MTAQWPSLASLETGLHANRRRTQTSSIANHTTAQGASWPVADVFPTVGKIRRSDGAIQSDPATRDRTDCVRGTKRARRAATTR